MSDVRVIELSKYTQPCVVENVRLDWVEYGEKDGYYQFLIDRFRNSPTNNTAINQIARLIYGGGLSAYNASRKPNDYASVLSMISKDDLRAVCTDLKMLGEGAFQVIYTDNRKAVSKIKHIPKQLLRPNKCNEKGEIIGHWYSDNWDDVRKYPPTFIPAFGTSSKTLEVLVFGRYSVGRKYFSDVDYQGGLDYAVLEEEIATYLINETQNSFSPTMVVNFNNGVGTEETRKKTANNVQNKLTGSAGKKVVVSFNDNEQARTTIDAIPLNDAPQHYDYLSKEAREKLLASHGVTSPMLIGVVTENQGFNSNADEIEIASKYFHNHVILPFQEMIIDALDKIVAVNGISLDFYFKRLNLLADKEAEQNAVKMSSEACCLSSHSNDEKVASQLIELGEMPQDSWLLISESEVDYNEDENEPSLLSKIWNFVSTGTANPNAKSEQDETLDGIKFITRYRYDGQKNDNSRPFCVEMLKANKIYRKEDIIRMGSIPVNSGWGAEGAATYSIWLYKGGGLCHHKWIKQIYANFEGSSIDVNNPNAKQIAESKAQKYGYIVNNPALVSKRPVDTPHFGFLPTNKRYGK